MKFYLQNNLYPAGCLKNTHHISPKKKSIYLKALSTLSINIVDPISLLNIVERVRKMSNPHEWMGRR